MKKWQIQKPNPEVVRQFMVQSDLSALSASVLAARNIRTVEEAAAFLCCDGLSDPFLTADMQEAAQALNEAIDAGTKICVYGDYDCDGVVSTVILYTYLMELGADVTWYIPERAEGYGMNADSLRRLQKEGVACIVTVDNGIAALEEAELLAELGITLIITDHHQPSDGKLPRARAVVDPHRADSNDVFRPLCGAGVALKLIMAMEDGDATIAMEEFGELAAIATVADVVPLQGENRYLVQQGLRLLANTERPGLLALLDVAGLTGKKLTATSIAYSLAPRINAAGRFGSPRQAVELLLCEDPEEAHALADQLEQCNRQRKEVEEQILQEMIAQTEQHPELLQQRVAPWRDWHCSSPVRGTVWKAGNCHHLGRRNGKRFHAFLWCVFRICLFGRLQRLSYSLWRTSRRRRLFHAGRPSGCISGSGCPLCCQCISADAQLDHAGRSVAAAAGYYTIRNCISGSACTIWGRQSNATLCPLPCRVKRAGSAIRRQAYQAPVSLWHNRYGSTAVPHCPGRSPVKTRIGFRSACNSRNQYLSRQTERQLTGTGLSEKRYCTGKIFSREGIL